MRLEQALAGKSSGSTVANFNGFSGVWKNELASTMVLDVKNGVVSGSYESIVSSTGQKATGVLIGFAEDDIISFIVKWDGSASMTSWVGQVEDINGKETLKTLWHLIRDIPDADEPSKAWSAILAGADQFTRP